MTAILGVNYGVHDASAALVVDGRLVAAAEEERFNREKHTASFPEQAARYCLRTAGIDLADLAAVAVPFRPWRLLASRAAQIVRYLPRSAGLPWRDRKAAKWRELAGARRLLAERLGGPGIRLPPVTHEPHHLCHAAAAYYASPFDEAALLALDGAGETCGTWFGRGRGGRIDRLAEVRLPHSLGLLYSGLTGHLGFQPWCDEGKVMGLAAYGRPTYLARLRRVAPGTDGTFRLDMDYFGFQHGGWGTYLSPLFARTFGPPRRPGEPVTGRDADLAASLQKLLEETVLRLAGALRRRTGARYLCLSGGVALNSVANGRLLAEAGFEDLFVPPAASDAGCALGAAWLVDRRLRPTRRPEPPADFYLGPEFGAEAIDRALLRRGLAGGRLADPAAEAAARLAGGQIVGWFQGRLEFGPRALGNRSILADPRDAGMRGRLNRLVKRRESFRPYAPAVLAERRADYFDIRRPERFMLATARVRPERRAAIPAVVHADGSARLQTVAEADNPLFHRLIAAFEQLTGVPVVLNTSLNLRGEPIVCSPDEAIAVFLGSGMDALILGDRLVAREPAAGAGAGGRP